MVSMHRGKVMTALVLVIILVASGCAGRGTVTTATSTTKVTSTAAPAPAPTGPYGSLKYGMSTFGQELFDPTKGSATVGLEMSSPMTDMLFTLDEQKKLAPSVADSWELAPDGLSWTFRIHKGIKFHNGDDLTAADVKFSFERYMSPGAYQANYRNAIDHVDKVDDYTVRVYTKGRQPFLPLLASIYYPTMGLVMPKDYIEKNGVDYFQLHPIGSGPFKFVKHMPGDSIEWQALDKHWRRVPAFASFKSFLIPEEATRIAMLKTGLLDIAQVALGSVGSLEQAGLRTVSPAAAQDYILLWGAYVPEALTANLPLTNLKVRQALSLAINRDEINKGLFFGKASPPIPAFMGVDNAVDVDIPYWQDQAQKVYARYDPQEAIRLLKEAGYPDSFASPVIKFWSYSQAGGEYFPDVVQIVAGYWQKIGVKVEIFPTDMGSMQSVASTLKFPTLRGAAGQQRVTGRPVAPQILQSYVSTTGLFALLGRAFPKVDTLVTDIFSETDAGKRKTMLAEVMKTIADAYVGLPIGGVPMIDGLGPEVDFPTGTVVPELAVYAERVKHRAK